MIKSLFPTSWTLAFLATVFVSSLVKAADIESSKVDQRRICTPDNNYWEDFFAGALGTQAAPTTTGVSGATASADLGNTPVAKVEDNSPGGRSPANQADTTTLNPKPNRIPNSCMEASLLKYNQEPTGKRYNCLKEPPELLKKNQGACVSKNQTQYMSQQLNGALECLNSSPSGDDVKVSAREIFGIFNHETGFQEKMTTWSNGVGIPQIAGITLRDFLSRRKGGAYTDFEAVMNNPQCTSLIADKKSGETVVSQISDMVDKKKEISSQISKGKGFCELLSPRYLGRAFVLGISIYKHYKELALKYLSQMKEELAKLNVEYDPRDPNFSFILEWLAQEGYSGGEGPQRAKFNANKFRISKDLANKQKNIKSYYQTQLGFSSYRADFVTHMVGQLEKLKKRYNDSASGTSQESFDFDPTSDEFRSKIDRRIKSVFSIMDKAFQSNWDTPSEESTKKREPNTDYFRETVQADLEKDLDSDSKADVETKAISRLILSTHTEMYQLEEKKGRKTYHDGVKEKLNAIMDIPSNNCHLE